MPLQATSGAASYDAFGGGVPVVPTYIEEVFGTFLYTGTRSTQTITNGIDLSTKGGLVWIKERTQAGYDHALFDTARGVNKQLKSNLTNAEVTYSGSLTSFGTTGFTLGADSAGGYVNDSLTSHVSWTFRKQPKFFDVVTYTGDGTAGRTVAHNLGSVPGCVIVKRTDAVAGWLVYHRSLGATDFLRLDTTDSTVTSALPWNNTAPTSTNFTVGTSTGANASGGTYVAYLFAHDAGGFGLTGTDNVISCGSFTASGTGGDVTLGYEPQWVMIKRTDSTGNSWRMLDIMRGYDNSDTDAILLANQSSAETFSQVGTPFANGFTEFLAAGTYIYIAIRRGPMKVPTSGTSVFTPAIRTGTATTTTITGVGFPPDAVLSSSRNYPAYGGYLGQFWDRLRGAGKFLRTPESAAEGTVANAGVLGQDGYTVSNSSGGQNDNNDPFVDYSFRRAPSFFDEVCYTGTGSATTQTHNLGVVPELTILRARDTANSDWVVCFNTTSTEYRRGFLSYDFAINTTTYANNFSFGGQPTATTITLGGNYFNSNRVGFAYVAYLFATCAGVSKVGTYTGTGTTLQIDCGFTGGARFVLIKRYDSTGDWYVWDTARGIVSGNDSYLLLNSTAAEVTNTDYIDTYSAGFELSSTAPAAINASGGTFIFFAVA